MSASNENKPGTEAAILGGDRRKDKRRKEKQDEHRSMILYTVVGIICAVAAIALVVFNSGMIQRHTTAVTINGVKYTAADVQYYYSSTKNNLLNYYYGNFGITPFDTSTSLKDQVYDSDSGQTWYDYLVEQALDSMVTSAALADKANAEGYTLSDDAQTQLDDSLKQLESAWAGAGYGSRDAYIHAVFGPYMSYKELVKLATQQALASDYSSSYSDSLTYDDAACEAYYQENANTLDTFTLTQFALQATVETTDADGNTIDMTDDEKAAKLEEAKAAVKAKAQEIQAKLQSGSDAQALADEYADDLFSSSIHDTRVGSNLNSAYSEWMLDAARKNGDVDLAEYDAGDTSYYYYVVRYEGHARDDSATATVRHILVAAETDDGADQPTDAQYAAAKTKAEDLLEQWKSGDATEDSFAQLATENSADSGSAANGGLISNINKNSGYVQTFTDWALDSARQPGDTGIVQNTGSSTKGWHIMYYVAAGDPVWKQTAANALRSADYTKWTDEVKSGYEAVKGAGLEFVNP